ncbi:ABC transporter substrate-binding protein [Modestobacter sp. Leaf380]|uniref:ABC transporter substrate-binding protein n=1 Tax=Modestobacter sp. Leaf380 TaxID=1736356 RepID=UPI0006FCBA6A|nr:ABC transporter substrate-binding protein [Modestobacter sp. Leaf380]KQS63602.1 hypothetical protein ASG41_18305 [Modestobacter sp. Leaf380]
MFSSLQVSRRSLLLGGGLLGLAVAGCGTGAGSSTAEPGPTTPGTVDFAYEDVAVTVPARPRRVVVMEGRGDLEFALLAGWTLVGVRNTSAPGERPSGQYAGLVDDAVPLLDSAEDAPDVEEIAALAPDLILVRANNWRMDAFGNDVLAQVAPVLPVEVNRPGFREDMTAQLAQFDLTARADDALADYDAAVLAGRVALAALGRTPTAAVLATQMAETGSVRWYTNKLATTVAADLGFAVLGLDPADVQGDRTLSLEEIGMVSEAEFLFHQTPEPAPVVGVPTWDALPAVVAGRATTLDPVLNNGLALTATAIAERMTVALTA